MRISLQSDIPKYTNITPAVQLSDMMGIAPEDWPRYKKWNDKILGLSLTRRGGDQAQRAMGDFNSVTSEMSAYLEGRIVERQKSLRGDLLTRLLEAELEGDRLTHEEILAFFRLLMFAGQETTTNLLNNAVLSFLDHPDQFWKLRNAPQLLPSAIEEVLRYRSPVQWMMRTPLRECGGARHAHSERRICASSGRRGEQGP